MTSFAFILGVAPLVVGRGAGFEMRQSLGISVFSGMIGVTIFGLIFTPVFYVLIDWLGTLTKKQVVVEHGAEPLVPVSKQRWWEKILKKSP